MSEGDPQARNVFRLQCVGCDRRIAAYPKNVEATVINSNMAYFALDLTGNSYEPPCRVPTCARLAIVILSDPEMIGLALSEMPPENVTRVDEALDSSPGDDPLAA